MELTFNERQERNRYEISQLVVSSMKKNKIKQVKGVKSEKNALLFQEVRESLSNGTQRLKGIRSAMCLLPIAPIYGKIVLCWH